MLYRCGQCQKDFEVASDGNYRCPHCQTFVRVGVVQPQVLDWEHRKEIGFWKAFFETLKKSLLDPVSFFDSVPPSGGFESPIYFGVICGVIGMLFSLLYQFAFQGMGFLFQSMMKPLNSQELVIGGGLTLFIFSIIALTAPITAFVSMFIRAGIYHLFLWLVGGNQKGFEATFRAFAYSQGPQILQIVPFLGPFVTWIWELILLILGLKRIHETTYGKSLAAVLLPMLLLCALTIFLVVGLIFLIAALIGYGNAQRF
ncbi:MAG: YIP1 family protein [Deltaproteobacteria bacterium]|nr:YIP1 family protein [Deltaproteobacteria bacterium]